MPGRNPIPLKRRPSPRSIEAEPSPSPPPDPEPSPSPLPDPEPLLRTTTGKSELGFVVRISLEPLPSSAPAGAAGNEELRKELQKAKKNIEIMTAFEADLNKRIEALEKSRGASRR